MYVQHAGTSYVVTLSNPPIGKFMDCLVSI